MVYYGRDFSYNFVNRVKTKTPGIKSHNGNLRKIRFDQ